MDNKFIHSFLRRNAVLGLKRHGYITQKKVIVDMTHNDTIIIFIQCSSKNQALGISKLLLTISSSSISITNLYCSKFIILPVMISIYSCTHMQVLIFWIRNCWRKALSTLAKFIPFTTYRDSMLFMHFTQ